MLPQTDFFSQPVDMTPRVFSALTPPADWPVFTCTTVSETIQYLKDHVVEALATYEPPDIQTKLRDKNARWKAMSALQKAVRRGNVELAQRAGHALWCSGFASGFWYRLAVISYEDIGIADPVACALINLLGAEKSWRAKLDEKKAMFWIIEQACKAPKSRDACMLEVYAGLDNCPQRANAIDMVSWEPADLLRAARGEFDGASQFVAHWMIFGGGSKHKWFGVSPPPATSWPRC